MTYTINKARAGWKALLVLPLALASAAAHAVINGVAGPSFSLTAKSDYISTGDGNSLIVWGYANGASPLSYPGPTLVVNQGDNVTVELSNQLPVTVSMVFPGQADVTATGSDGVLTKEAAPGATATYSFTANQPGTYLYYSGTNPALQVEMGLVGTLIVRPAGVTNQAYTDPVSAYAHEYLVLLTEMDHRIHEAVAAMTTAGLLNDTSASAIDLSGYHATLWFINGRNAPDSLMPDNIPWLPTQPNGSLVRMLPGEDILIRLVGAGRDMHPFHTHGNHFRQIAQDGRMLNSPTGNGADLQRGDYTMRVVPGETFDILFTWTGKDLGWDIYGTDQDGHAHTCNGSNAPSATYDPTTKEWCGDHNVPIPVKLPQQQDMMFGGMWSGSPYLGVFGALPPGDGGMNPNAGYTYMWHSHNEVELTNDDIFPGGIMTMLVIEPPGTVIP